MKSLNEISVQFIKGVGPAKKKLFENLGVETIEDLLYFFPRRYEDRTHLTPINKVKPGEFQTVCGKVLARGGKKSWYNRKHVFEMALGDERGRIFCVWFNQPYLENYFYPGKQVVVYGKVDIYKNRLQMNSPEYEIIEHDDDKKLHTGRIVPIYPLTKGISQRYIRKIIYLALEQYKDYLQDILPPWLRNKHRLLSTRSSISNIHFPENAEQQEQAQKRISFEEFFLFQISVIKRRQSIVAKNGIAHGIDLALIQQFEEAFPFTLTGAQTRVIREITCDMQKSSPMLRLLQGDVGSGKTVAAFFGCVAAYKNGKQSAIMAPTEILARQHCESISRLIANSPFKNLRWSLLVSSLKKSERDEIHQKLKEGKLDLVIGTHALLNETLDFKSLSFVVIDEQHKFGVKQRALLSTKGVNPDVLVMTATPIPRTLSLTLFGDLDVSTIDEMPKGRGKIDTKLYSIEQAAGVYLKIKEMIKQGQQAYIVYPLVEDSINVDLKAAETMFKRFQKQEFKDLKLGLVHGQMKRDESESTIAKFKNKELDVLVATTVLEVGIDVPNASIMVIEHAERFGLAQLHQLRGRIGRGINDSICYLIADPTTEDGNARLKAILQTTDGFKIAEQDLLIRGPGHYFGRHQHGLNELRFANPLTQIETLQLARKEAQELVHKDPDLNEAQNAILRAIILKRYPGYLEMTSAG